MFTPHSIDFHNFKFIIYSYSKINSIQKLLFSVKNSRLFPMDDIKEKGFSIILNPSVIVKTNDIQSLFILFSWPYNHFHFLICRWL